MESVIILNQQRPLEELIAAVLFHQQSMAVVATLDLQGQNLIARQLADHFNLLCRGYRTENQLREVDPLPPITTLIIVVDPLFMEGLMQHFHRRLFKRRNFDKVTHTAGGVVLKIGEPAPIVLS